MVAHGIEHLLGRDLFRRFHPQRHPVGGIVPHRVVGIGVHSVGHAAEKTPHAGFAGTQCREIGRRISVAETELRIRSLVVPHLAGERDHVGRIEAVVGIVEREGRDARLIGMARHITVGNAARHPHDSLAGVATLAVRFETLADHLHDPRLVRIGDRKRLAFRRIAVGIGQIGHHADRLARRAGALQRDVDHRTVVHASRRIGQFAAAAVGRFSDDERMFVHVPHRGIGMFHLRDVAQITPRVPLVDGEHFARTEPALRCVELIEAAVQRMRIGGIAHQRRRIGRSAARDDEVGTRSGRGAFEQKERRQDRQQTK